MIVVRRDERGFGEGEDTLHRAVGCVFQRAVNLFNAGRASGIKNQINHGHVRCRHAHG